MNLQPAKTAVDAIALCDPSEPLKSGDPRWQDLSRSRSGYRDDRILTVLKNYSRLGRFACIALAGHRGSGKSTELYRVKDRAERDRYRVIYCRVNEELDPYDLDWPDLSLLISRMVEEDLRQGGILLPRKTLDHISNWFKEITRIKESEIQATLGVGAEAEAKAGIPFFGKLMLNLTSRIQGGQKSKNEVREQVRHYPKALVENVNLLLDDARRMLPEQQRELVLVFDNVDRYKPEIADQVLLKGAEILQSVRCHCIYTVPISLVYDPLGDTVGQRYHQEVLPMVKVKERDDSEHRPGIEDLLDALNKRVDVGSVFADASLAEDLVRMSGGCMRDLLKLTQEACLNAEERVNQRAVEQAIQTVRSEMARSLLLTDYPLLARIHIKKTLPGQDEHRRLLYRRSALEYNGDRWADVHPLIQGLKEFQDALAEERKRQ